MAENDQYRVDRTRFEVVTLAEADDEVDYWATRTPEERLTALETIRGYFYGYHGTVPRLQRVLTFSEREPG